MCVCVCVREKFNSWKSSAFICFFAFVDLNHIASNPTESHDCFVFLIIVLLFLLTDDIL